MVECMTGDDSLDLIFHALADGTRRSILRHLSKAEHNVRQIAQYFPITLAAVSKHLQVLDAASLISRRRVGKSQMIRLNAVGMKPAEEWLTHYEAFWTLQLDAIQNFLEGESK